MTKDCLDCIPGSQRVGCFCAARECKKDMALFFNDWFDNSGYVFDHTKFDLECYLEEETYIYVPIRNADLKE